MIRNRVIQIMIPVAVLLAALSAMVYFSINKYFAKLYTDTICNIEIDVLEQKNNNLSYLTENIKNIFISIRLDDAIEQLMYGQSMNVNEQQNARKQLNSVRIASDLIDSIYLLNRRDREVYVTMEQGEGQYTEENFFDQDVFRLLEDIDSYGTYTPTARRIIAPNGKTKDILTFITYDYFQSSGTIDGIIVVNVPMRWVDKKLNIEEYEAAEGSRLLFVEERGCAEITSDKGNYLVDMSEEEYVAGVLRATTNKGSFVTQIEGIDCLVTYRKNGYSNWSVISTIAYEDIQDRLKPISRFSVLVSLSIFAAGLIVLGTLSKRLTDKMGNMEHQMLQLQMQNKTYAIEHKNEFVQFLLRGSVNGDPVKVREQYTERRLKTASSGLYVLIIFEIDRFQAFCKSSNLDERNEKIAELLEIIETKILKDYCCDVGQISENRVVALCNITKLPDTGELYGRFEKIISEIQEEAAHKLLLGISAAVSEVGNSYEGLPYLYEEVSHYIEQRYFYGYRSIIYASKLPQKKHEISISEIRKLESAIISSLNKSQKEEMDALLREYFNMLKDRQPHEIKVMITNMVLQVQQSMANENFIFVEDQLNRRELLSGIANAETLEETERYLDFMLEESLKYLEEKKQEKYKTLVEDIKEYIEEHYAQETLSINVIADNVNLSVAYLGRIFKNIEGVSIADYIMQVRLEHAKQLLRNTDFSANEISDFLGFVNRSYFYYVFKKKYDMTPNQYRMSYKTEKI